MVSNGFELLFWVVLMAIMFMLGSLVQQSKLDKARIKLVVLEHDNEKYIEEISKNKENHKEEVDDLHKYYGKWIDSLREELTKSRKEIERLHRKYGD